MEKGKKSDLKGAIKLYNKALEIDSKFELAYLMRGTAKLDLGDYGAARYDYDRAIYINPNNPGAYRCRGIVQHKSDDLKGACEDWKKAAELGDEKAAELLKNHSEESNDSDEIDYGKIFERLND